MEVREAFEALEEKVSQLQAYIQDNVGSAFVSRTGKKRQKNKFHIKCMHEPASAGVDKFVTETKNVEVINQARKLSSEASLVTLIVAQPSLNVISPDKISDITEDSSIDTEKQSITEFKAPEKRKVHRTYSAIKRGRSGRTDS